MRELRVTIALILTLVFYLRAEAQEIEAKQSIQHSVTSYVNDNLAAIVSDSPSEIKYGVNVSQLPSQRYKNTLSIGYGVLFGALYIPLFDLYDKVYYNDKAYDTSLSSQLADDRYYWGAERAFTGISIDYNYRMKRWFAIGAKGVVSLKSRAKRHIGTNEVLYRDNTLLVSALLNMRFDWLNRKIVTMYSSLGLGIVSHMDYYETYVLPMYDAAWIGITVGQRLYGYAELGGGIGGLFRVGLGYRF